MSPAISLSQSWRRRASATLGDQSKEKQTRRKCRYREQEISNARTNIRRSCWRAQRNGVIVVTSMTKVAMASGQLRPRRRWSAATGCDGPRTVGRAREYTSKGGSSACSFGAESTEVVMLVRKQPRHGRHCSAARSSSRQPVGGGPPQGAQTRTEERPPTRQCAPKF